jgi:membrane protease YdiL (CAAX protease family)
MPRLFKEEFTALGQFLKNYRSEIIIVVTAALLFSLASYHPIGSDWLNSFFYYGFCPIIAIIFFLRKKPLDFGLGLGNPKIWGLYTVIFCIIAAIILYLSSFSPALKAYYLEKNFNFLKYFLTSVLSLSAWEFIYRGFLLFGLKDKFKEGSILLQMIPFVLLHLGKPELETVSTIITGILFGYIAYRGRSYWPAFIMHLFINVFFVSLINFRYG